MLESKRMLTLFNSKEKELDFDLQELEWISLETLEKMKEMSFFFSSVGEEDEHIY